MASSKIDGIEIDNGNILYFASYGSGQALYGSYYLERGNRHTPTLTHMPFNINMIGSEDTSFQDIFGYITGVHPASYFQTQEFKDALERADSSVYWLWGNISSGGVYIRRESATQIALGAFMGIYRNTQTDEITYNISEVNRYYKPNDELMFLININSYDATDKIPPIDVFSLSGLGGTYYEMTPAGSTEPIRVYTTYFCMKIFNQLLNTYGDEIEITSMEQCTRYITWEGVLGDKPSCIWYANQKVDHTFPYNIYYPLMSDASTDVWELIGGNLWVTEDALDEEAVEDPSGEGGYSTSGGGGFGSYPTETGNIDFSDPTEMAIDCVNSGFVTLYNPSLTEVKSFNKWLFSDVTDAMSNIMKRLITDPIDYVLFLALAHFTPPSDVVDTIVFCGINTDITANKVSRQFHKIDCGTIHLDGDTQTFLDYNPNTKISIYLPYIGIKELNVDEVVGSDIHVMYYIDLLNGSCIAEIKCTRSVRLSSGDSYLNDVLYHFNGNCYEMIPITGTDWRGLASSAISLIGGVAAVANNNPSGLTEMAKAVLQDKVKVTHSSNNSSSYGYMDNQRPYIIIERPISSLPYNYRGFKGYTLNQRRRLGSLKGYTEIEEGTLWTDSFNGISEEEAEMLKQITATGFYL